MGSRYQPGELRRRVITGFAGAILAVTAIAVSPWGLWVALVVISLAMYREWLRLGEIQTTRVASWLCFAWVLLLWMALAPSLPLIAEDNVWAGFSILLLKPEGFVVLFVLLPLLLLFDQDATRMGFRLGWYIVGIAIAVGPLVLLWTHAWDGPGSRHWVLSLGVIMQIWAADIAAYFGGKTFGKRLLLPRVSPQKTWEGVLAGALGAYVLATFWYLLGPPVPYNWFVIAGIVAVFAPLGDLMESQLKRSAGVKDSGTLLPGHGGMLDRFDGFLLTLPVIYLYLRLWVG